VWEKWLTLTLV